jgi:hypothetical protein
VIRSQLFGLFFPNLRGCQNCNPTHKTVSSACHFYACADKVCDAVEVAGKNVMSTSSIVTTGLVSHRYISI